MELTGNFEIELERKRDGRGADLPLAEAIAKRLNGMMDWIPETKRRRVDTVAIDENGAETASGTWTGSHGARRLSGTWTIRWIRNGLVGYVDLVTPD